MTGVERTLDLRVRRIPTRCSLAWYMCMIRVNQNSVSVQSSTDDCAIREASRPIKDNCSILDAHCDKSLHFQMQCVSKNPPYLFNKVIHKIKRDVLRDPLYNQIKSTCAACTSSCKRYRRKVGSGKLRSYVRHNNNNMRLLWHDSRTSVQYVEERNIKIYTQYKIYTVKQSVNNLTHNLTSQYNSIYVSIYWIAFFLFLLLLCTLCTRWILNK